MSLNAEFNSPLSLPAVGWVASLKEEDRELLASYGDFVSAQKDQTLVQQGEEQSHLYLVISGSLEVSRQGLTEDIIVGVIQTGEAIGEVSIFDPGPASATVKATEFSQIWKIDNDSLNSFLSDNPTAGNYLMVGLATILSQRMRNLNSQLVDAKTPPHM